MYNNTPERVQLTATPNITTSKTVTDDDKMGIRLFSTPAGPSTLFAIVKSEVRYKQINT